MIDPMKHFVYLIFKSSTLVCKSPSVLVGARCYSPIHSGILNEILGCLRYVNQRLVQYFNLLPIFEGAFPTLNPCESDGLAMNQTMV